MARKKRLIALPELARIRNEKEISLREMNDISGVAASTVHYLERPVDEGGELRGARPSTALKIADALGVSVSDLAGREVSDEELSTGGRQARYVSVGAPRSESGFGYPPSRSFGGDGAAHDADDALARLIRFTRGEAERLTPDAGGVESDMVREYTSVSMSLENAMRSRAGVDLSRAGSDDPPKMTEGGSLALAVEQDRRERHESI